MKNYILSIYARKEAIESKNDLLVFTAIHSDKKRLLDISKKYIDNDNHGDFTDDLTQDDFYIEIELYSNL